MIRMMNRNESRKFRHERIREKVTGTAEKPRVCVYRSARYIYAQAVDDMAGRTLLAASSLEKAARASFKGHARKDAAKWVGQNLAKRLAEKGIKDIAFDRNGFPYHGIVKELAEAMREAGMRF